MRYIVALVALAFASPLAAQNYPTTVRGDVAKGVVPLQCNAAQAECAPTTSTSPAPVYVPSKGLASSRWGYTSGATGILSNTTTAVTIKAAAAAGVANVIDSCQITTTAFGAAVPLALRDGAGGTVMWAVIVPTGGFLQPANILFEPGLAGTAATLIEAVTTTANTSGTVTLNCQGHTE